MVVRAGIVDDGRTGTRTLLTEPIVVLLGQHLGTLDAFTQDGDSIGEAAKTGFASPIIGYRYQYEICDSEPRCAIRETTKRGLFVKDYSFVIVGSDATELASAALKAGADCVFSRGGKACATLHQLTAGEVARNQPPTSQPTRAGRILQVVRDWVLSGRRDSNVFSLSDVTGQRVACITHVRPSTMRNQVGFVVNFDVSPDHESRLIALASCVIADNRMLDFVAWGDQ